jgi:hypothetical protein
MYDVQGSNWLEPHVYVLRLPSADCWVCPFTYGFGNFWRCLFKICSKMVGEKEQEQELSFSLHPQPAL